MEYLCKPRCNPPLRSMPTLPCYTMLPWQRKDCFARRQYWDWIRIPPNCLRQYFQGIFYLNIKIPPPTLDFEETCPLLPLMRQ